MIVYHGSNVKHFPILNLLERLQGRMMMNNEKFVAVMGIIVPQVLKLITKNYAYDEITKNYAYDEIRAASEFYSSDLYALLEQEDTKLWYFSSLTLFNMFDEEKKTGSFTIPEEV